MDNAEDLYYLPNKGEDIELLDFFEISFPGYTYKLIINQNFLRGMTDEAEALLQAVYLILNTERYRYAIYSSNYGVELEDLIGKEKDFAMSEVKRRIYEALMQDDRIIDVDSFEFASEGKWVEVSFVVHTVYGEIEARKEIRI